MDSAPTLSPSRQPSADSQKPQAEASRSRPSNRADGRLPAGRQLPLGRTDLPLDNPLLKEPLRREHIKPRLLGHSGDNPGLNHHVHLNRVIKKRT